MLVLVGKTCVGKDTIRNILVNEYGMERVVTYTSRPPREGEVDGVDYHFIKLSGKNYFDDKFIFHNLGMAEVTEYNVASGETWFYGSSVYSYENADNKVIILNPDGLKAIRKKGIKAFVVWIDSPESLIKGRQMARGDNPEEAERRRNSDLIDFADISKYTDTCVINWGDGGPERCARTIYNVYEHWRNKNVED